MLLPKTFELTAHHLPNLLGIVRTSTSRANVMKRLMRENKENFGPLLESRRNRKKRETADGTRRKKNVEFANETKTNEVKVRTKKVDSSCNLKSVENVDEEVALAKSPMNEKKVEKTAETSKVQWTKVADGEMSWAIGSTRVCNLKILRTNKKIASSTVTKNAAEGSQTDNNNSSSNNNCDKLAHEAISGDLEPFVETKITKNIRIDKSHSTYQDSGYVPITNSGNDVADKWDGAEIVSLSPVEKRDFCLPGVTRILSETMSEEAKMILDKWKNKMIQKLGVDGFNEYSAKQLEDSKQMHQLIERTLRREAISEIPPHLEPSFNSIKLVLKDVTDVRIIESHVVHPTLEYRGFVDCVANYRGNLCIIDWKKSERIKTLSTTYDSPLQVSAYIGALNADPNYPFQVKTGVLAIAYSRGQPPSVFEFTAAKLEYYWREWLKRLDKYRNASGFALKI